MNVKAVASHSFCLLSFLAKVSGGVSRGCTVLLDLFWGFGVELFRVPGRLCSGVAKTIKMTRYEFEYYDFCMPE
jgi:hypothetical protein